MNTKKYILLIIGFAFSLFSCNKENDAEDIPIFVTGEFKITLDEEKWEYYKTIETDGMIKAGAYYMDIWMRLVVIDNGGLYLGFAPDYYVEVNGKKSEFSFKTHNTSGSTIWQSITLKDEKEVAATIQLREGINSISIIGANVMPIVELIKFYKNPLNAGITDVDLTTVFGFTGSVYPESFLPPKPPPLREVATFTEDELNQIATLTELLPDKVKTDFEEKFIAWQYTWFYILQSIPRAFAQSDEYKSLLTYCEQYGKAMLPLIFKKIHQNEVFVVNLLEDLTEFRLDEVDMAILKKYDFITTYIMIDYAKILLEIEYDNILKAIQEIPEMENED